MGKNGQKSINNNAIDAKKIKSSSIFFLKKHHVLITVINCMNSNHITTITLAQENLAAAATV